MTRPSRDQVELHIQADSEPEVSKPEDDEPFQIALLGDFSGRSERGSISDRKPLIIDRDNFETVLQKLDVGVELPAGRLPIRDMEDFHPDRIYASYPIFRQLRSTRERLADPETFAETVREIGGEPLPALPSAAAGSLLDQILGIQPSAAKPVRKLDVVQQVIDNAIRPHLVARQDPRAPEILSQVDKTAGDLMRAVLHHPKFQAVEAAWRSVFTIISELETGPELKVYLFDVTKEELAEHPDIVYQKLGQRPEPWALLAGNYAFGADDIPLMTVLGKIAARLHAPFVGHADPSLLDGTAEWSRFRHTPEAAQISLALPRVLLRLPYGKQTSACETFEFEEVSGKPTSKQMLFGNAALLCSMLIGKAFEADGWNLRPGTVRDIGGLPIYVYKDDDESIAFPCAEVELPQETAEALIENGFMPMAAIRNRDVVRALAFQSVADPPTALRGRWT